MKEAAACTVIITCLADLGVRLDLEETGHPRVPCEDQIARSHCRSPPGGGAGGDH